MRGGSDLSPILPRERAGPPAPRDRRCCQISPDRPGEGGRGGEVDEGLADHHHGAVVGGGLAAAPDLDASRRPLRRWPAPTSPGAAAPLRAAARSVLVVGLPFLLAAARLDDAVGEKTRRSPGFILTKPRS